MKEFSFEKKIFIRVVRVIMLARYSFDAGSETATPTGNREEGNGF
jgi:hypothetical protein